MPSKTTTIAQVNGKPETKVSKTSFSSLDKVMRSGGHRGKPMASTALSQRFSDTDSEQQAKNESEFGPNDTFGSLVGDVYADFNDLSTAFAKVLYFLNKDIQIPDLRIVNIRLGTNDYNRSARNHNRAIDNESNDKLVVLRNVLTGEDIPAFPATIVELENIVAADPMYAFYILAALGIELKHLHYPFLPYLRGLQKRGTNLSLIPIPNGYLKALQTEVENWSALVSDFDADNDDVIPAKDEDGDVLDFQNQGTIDESLLDGTVSIVDDLGDIVKDLFWTIRRVKQRLQNLSDQVDDPHQKQIWLDQKDSLDQLPIFAPISDEEGRRLLKRQLRIAVGLPPVSIDIKAYSIPDIHYL